MLSLVISSRRSSRPQCLISLSLRQKHLWFNYGHPSFLRLGINQCLFWRYCQEAQWWWRWHCFRNPGHKHTWNRKLRRHEIVFCSPLATCYPLMKLEYAADSIGSKTSLGHSCILRVPSPAAKNNSVIFSDLWGSCLSKSFITMLHV